MDSKKGKNKPKVTVKVKKVAPKKKVRPDSLKSTITQHSIHQAIEKYCSMNPEMYTFGPYFCIHEMQMVFKRVQRTVKSTNNRNIFMVFDHNVEETFIIPIVINIKLNSKPFPYFQKCKEFGFKTLTITSNKFEEIERKLATIT
jgi:hypothetical protein